MLFGIEIECYAPRDSHPVVNRKGYHGGNFSNNMWWKFESDSSLSNDYMGKAPVEMISNVIQSEEELEDAFKFLEKMFKSYTGFPLVIDETCGCHLHVGDHRWNRRFSFSRLLKIEKDYRKWLYGYDKKQSFAFKKNYYRRNYSKPNRSYSDYGARSSAFYNSNKGLEWRAFNLAGVQSFEDIKNRLRRAFGLLLEAHEEGELHARTFEFPQRWFKTSIKEQFANLDRAVKAIEPTMLFCRPSSGKRVVRRLTDGVVIVARGERCDDENKSFVVSPTVDTNDKTFKVKVKAVPSEFCYDLPKTPEYSEITFPKLRKSKRIYRTKYYKITAEE